MEILWGIPDDNHKEISSGGAWGTIYLKIEQYFFPGEYWDDFLIALMNLWLLNLIKLSEDMKTNDKLIVYKNFFYDGPFHFDVTLLTSSILKDEVKIQFIEDGVEKQRVLFETEMLLSTYRTTILQTGSDILRQCLAERYGTATELETLHQLLDALI